LHNVPVPPPEDAGEPLEITLERGETLEGRTRDSRGEPVAGAQVYALSFTSTAFGEASDTVHTGGDGRFRIDGLERGSYSVSATSPEGGEASAEVEIGRGANHVDLTFVEGVTIEGRVVDDSGAPVPRPAITLGSPDGTASSTREGAADGSFRIHPVPAGDYRLTAEAEGFAPTTLPDLLHVASQPVRGLVVRLGRGALLTGRLLGFAPEELPRIEVVISFQTLTTLRRRHATVSGESYRLGALSPGTWEVAASLNGERVASGSVTIGPGTAQANLDLDRQAGITLSGRILVNNAPFAQAVVMVRAADGSPAPGGTAAVRTAADGSFRISGLGKGPHLLSVNSTEGVSTTRPLDLAADQTLTIEIVTGRVRGQVVADTGEPVAEAEVAFQSAGGGINLPIPDLHTGADGAFQSADLAAGTYYCSVSKNGFRLGQERVTVPPGGTAQVRIVLEKEDGD
jgi:hypothetical protein